MEDVDRYMVIFPAIERYFVAAKKKAEFIGRVLEEMITIPSSPNQLRKISRQVIINISESIARTYTISTI
jgi:lipid A disaccharide synthetase